MPVANSQALVDQAARAGIQASANLSGSPYTTFPDPFHPNPINQTGQEHRGLRNVRTMPHSHMQYDEPSPESRAERNGDLLSNRAVSGQQGSLPLARDVNGINSTHMVRRGSDSASQSGRRPSSAPGKKEGLAIALANGNGAAGSSAETDDDDEPTSRRLGSKKPPMLRSKSDYGRRRTSSADEEYFSWGARHGFDSHYQSEDMLQQLANSWCMYYTDKRHETTGKPKVPVFQLQDWRMRDRLKTVSAALAVCLNIGVEPPDQLKTIPGAKLEAWQDPTVPPVTKALENIGKSLQGQYETLAIRTRYKQYLDPSVEETKKFCISLRRNAKEERVLLHYNGHGVPKPTASGEIWVFNKNYTQYIPVSLYDLQHWLAAPTIFVWDCSEAGNILKNFHKMADKHETEEEEMARRDPNYEMIPYKPYIHLAACSEKENLPTNPLLPADLFTCCLTTPIEMALWYFVLQNPLKTKLTPERAKKLPGRLQERRTPLGELNWIFTAITDTIAWTTFPRHLFRKFFRQDLMVAALFRNFLLAQRVMATYNCHPQSYPGLPDTRQHPLWGSWDLAVDMVLAQLPMLEKRETEGIEYEYKNSSFFAEQLTAFEIYLTRGDAMLKKPPEQLPVVLQVLLSQQHRVRALILLGRFLDLGPWAVQLALSIGIFPYVLKLLQSSAQELKPIMVFIWTRVLAVDISCQQDLIKDSGYQYFASILKPHDSFPVASVEEHKAMCAFILAMLCKGYKPGQNVCNTTDVMSNCLRLINNDGNDLLRQWSCLCISQLWQDLPEGKWKGIRENAHSKLAMLINDKCAEVRTAMVHTMTTFLGIPDLTDEVERIEESIAWTMLNLAGDGSPLVRKELLVFLSHFILRYENKFIVAAYEQLQEEKDYLLHPPHKRDKNLHKMGLHYTRPENREADGTIQPTSYGRAHDSVFAVWWKHATILSVDPHPEVQRDATVIVDYVHHTLLNSAVGGPAQNLMDDILRRAKKVSRGDTSQRRSVAGTNAAAAQPMPSPGLLKRTASYLFGPLLGSSENLASPTTPPASPGLQRTASASQRGRRMPVPEVVAAEEGEQATSAAHYYVAPEPLCAGYRERSLTEVPTLPLKSAFLEWSIEYFREPQMKPTEAEEPGSTQHNERLWRRSRNEAILRETQPQKMHAGTYKWNKQLPVINNGAQPSKMTLHQFEHHLAVADDANTVHVWDWTTQSRKSRFSNGNPEGSVICDLKYINEDDLALLMTGSSDGVIRIYRNYESNENVELASSWRALTNMVPSHKPASLVFDWQQVNGQVLVAGDERVIRIWRAGSETCQDEIPARSGACVTSLTSDQMTGDIFVAGFEDGAIRVYDTRLPAKDSLVRKWKDEPQPRKDPVPVRSVHMQRGGQRELLSASRDGTVRLWDIRKDEALKTFRTMGNDTLMTASTHEHLPVFAVGSSSRYVKVFNFDGKELSLIEPYSSFLQGYRGAAISATAFHPHYMTLACAARGDHHIHLVSCGNERA